MDNERYAKIDKELQNEIRANIENHWINPYAFRDCNAVRRNNDFDKASLWRPVFVRDIEKILHLPFYNRYTDKTQVFSFNNNDDITRRALHVQLVSRIARNIGRVLGLNLDLIESIALGHDIGHTPFGHAGERFLDELYHDRTGRYFFHNVHSVRVLDRLFPRNFTMQTLDGVLCHNGESEHRVYEAKFGKSFEDFDAETQSCYAEGKSINEHLQPATLEGCVVRICDIIAYLGKDRQDAVIAGIIDSDQKFTTNIIGSNNARIINNLTVDIIENSYGKDKISMSQDAFDDLKTAKDENYAIIYKNKSIADQYDNFLKPMFQDMYEKLLKDVKNNDTNSFIFKHHIDYINRQHNYYEETVDYVQEEPNQIVVDYIASMTDDYFLQLYKKLFPDSSYEIPFASYFE